MGAQAVRLSNVDIDNALKNKEFEVLFQPIFDLGNGALARVETFVRWRHPSLGVLPPGAFISFFETQGRMSELTRYVLAGALSAYSEWRGPYAPGFSINLALSDLSDDAFATHFAKVLRDRDFAPDLVTLECPMPPVDLDLETASAHFARLAETGARLAIEVRGRANDLLRNIDPFPFDEIKTGGSAILRFARTVRGPGLSAIADLLDIANRSNAAITAVGVEDQASLSALRGLGFTAAQGNHLAKVGPLNEFRPGRVNDVRKLLELEPLSSDSLTALFRTEAPAPAPADPAPESSNDDTAETGKEDDEQLVEDLAKRADAAKDEKAEKKPSADEAKKTRVREKAKALALAKRAKARDARKAAAIDRAKAKMAHAKRKAQSAQSVEPPAKGAFPPSQAPRDLQEQLNKEFAAGDESNQSPQQDDRGGEQIASPEPATLEQEPAPTAPESAAKETPAPVEASKEESNKKSDTLPLSADADEVADNAVTVSKPAAAATKKADKTNKETAPTPEASMPKTADVDEAAAGAVMDKISMAVGAARAYFRPGLRVGNPALRTTPAAAAPAPPQQAPEVTDRPAQLALDALAAAEPSDDPIKLGVPADTGEIEPEKTAPQPEHGLEHEPETDRASASDKDALVEGDLHRMLDVEPVPVKRRKIRRKNFLTRKYRLMPTHFWPKSWTRRKRRLEAARLAKQQASFESDAAQTE